MNAHTPGPWSFGPEFVARRTDNGLHDKLARCPETAAGTLRWRANAQLISAAPDLLAALIAVVSVADRKTAEFDLAHAAIAAATGKPGEQT